MTTKAPICMASLVALGAVVVAQIAPLQPPTGAIARSHSALHKCETCEHWPPAAQDLVTINRIGLLPDLSATVWPASMSLGVVPSGKFFVLTSVVLDGFGGSEHDIRLDQTLGGVTTERVRLRAMNEFFFGKQQSALGVPFPPGAEVLMVNLEPSKPISDGTTFSLEGYLISESHNCGWPPRPQDLVAIDSSQLFAGSEVALAPLEKRTLYVVPAGRFLVVPKALSTEYSPHAFLTSIAGGLETRRRGPSFIYGEGLGLPFAGGETIAIQNASAIETAQLGHLILLGFLE